MTDTINDVRALEACVGKIPGGVNLKVIDHLDVTARHWIAASPLMFVAFTKESGLAITLGGGSSGFACAENPAQLILPLAALDQPQLALVGAGVGVGTLFLVPGVRETLRVNGRIDAVDGGRIVVTVSECFMQCAKALIRSDFWNAMPHADAPSDAVEFLAASRFMALATRDAHGNVDISPRGDPAGLLIREQQGRVVYADRPGNRLADSFRNILSHPHIAAAVLIPGTNQSVVFSGSATLSSDESLRAGFVVRDKKPVLVTCVDRPLLAVADSAALGRAQLWPTATPPADIDPAAMFAAHVKLNKSRGVVATVARAAVAIPGIMKKGLESDYKNNLY